MRSKVLGKAPANSSKRIFETVGSSRREAVLSRLFGKRCAAQLTAWSPALPRRLRRYLRAGRKIRMRAITVIGPAMGRVKKIDGSPDDSSRDWRSVGSAIGPNTMASTAGASG